MKISNYFKPLALLLAIGCIFLFHHFAYIGHYGYDDMNYARIANDINHGAVDNSDHFTFRWAITTPTALCYKLFGINDLSSSLPSMIYASLILLIVFITVRKLSLAAVSISLALSIFTSWNLFYSDKLMPDTALAFSVVAIVFVLYYFKFQLFGKQPLLFAAFLSISFFIGFLAKGTIILSVPLLAFLAISDLLKKQHLKFWIYAAAFTILLFTIYSIYIKELTGELQGRFAAIYANSYLNKCSYDQQPVTFVIKRVAYEFFSMMIRQGMFVSGIFLITIIITKFRRKIFSHNNEESFFIVSSIILWLSANFMTISFTNYNPLCLDPRHYLFLTPITAIAIGYYYKSFCDSKKSKIIFTSIAFIVAIISYTLNQKIATHLYLPILLWIVISLFVPNRKWIQRILLVLFIAILCAPLWDNIPYAKQKNYPRQKEITKQFLNTIKGETVIISDEIQKRFNKYFLGFSYSNNISFLNFKEAEKDSSIYNKNIYVIDNKHTQHLSGLNKHNIPHYVKLNDKSQQTIINDSIIFFKVFSVTNIDNTIELQHLIGSSNSFENSDSLWSINTNLLNNTIAYSQPYCNKVEQYSSTFSLLTNNSFNNTNIMASIDIMINIIENANCSAVISVEHENVILHYDTYNLNERIKAYGNWHEVKFDFIINEQNIKPNCNLKIYILNNNNKEMYIDNFTIDIYSIEGIKL